MGPAVGRYEVMFRIAGGGMAEVFAGRVRGEAGFQKLVAIKSVLPHLAGEESIAGMFLDEARVAANIASPHVVQTLDVGRTDDGTPYLVMELVLGIDLAEMLRLAKKAGVQVPLDVAVEIVAQAALGLHAAHEARTPAGEPMHLVHRDISPQNLMIGADGRVRVTDFGIAWTALERLTQTSTGTYKGKYSYFSPEQSRRAKLDRRSDVFALGIVAWELVALAKLFSREDVIETIEAIRSPAIPSLVANRADVPAAIDEVIRRALAQQPDDRFATARQFAEALRGAARANGIEPSDAAVAAFLARLESPRLAMLQETLRQVVAAPRVETLAEIEVTGDDLAGSTVPAESIPERRRPPAVVAAVLGLAALIVGGVVVLAMGAVGGSEDPDAPPRVVAAAPAAPAPSPTPVVARTPPAAPTLDPEAPVAPAVAAEDASAPAVLSRRRAKTTRRREVAPRPDPRPVTRGRSPAARPASVTIFDQQAQQADD